MRGVFAALLDDEDLDVIEGTEDRCIYPALTEAIAGVDAEPGELTELDGFLTAIAGVLDTGGGKGSECRRFETLLRDTLYAGDHTTCIVFAQYTDTTDWLRERLAEALGVETVATYSGRGGQLPADGGTGWRHASKGEVTKAFRDAATNPDNPLKVLIGTDSMSEGLDLRTCDLLVNYDLPWNFMRAEQRLGRVDRIGGPEVAYVRNLLIRDTVEQRVTGGSSTTTPPSVPSSAPPARSPVTPRWGATAPKRPSAASSSASRRPRKRSRRCDTLLARHAGTHGEHLRQLRPRRS